ncbi:MAG: hypothetical protein U5K00_15275 [Melioribacteraceae bacterium]|nr:hypothetical protein [Melioribacteraceae bacterium]
MSLNSKQKKVIWAGSLVAILSLVVWFFTGGEIFTKTQVIVEKHDELLGSTYKEWQDKFILGLDYTLAFIAAVFFISVTAIILLRDKKKEN